MKWTHRDVNDHMNAVLQQRAEWVRLVHYDAGARASLTMLERFCFIAVDAFPRELTEDELRQWLQGMIETVMEHLRVSPMHFVDLSVPPMRTKTGL